MHSRGFTLLEVLVASFILFLAISTVTVVYSSAIKSKMSATSAVRLYAYLPLIRDDIKIKIQNVTSNSESGDGYFLGVTYRWSAKVVEQKESIPAIDIDNENFQGKTRQIKLWKVELSLIENRKESRHQFYVTGWLK